jgi:hypothetical protein
VSEFKNMTVLVSPVDAEVLVFAQQNAALYAVLRNKDVDKTIHEQLPAVRFDNLIEIQEIQTTRAKQGARFKPFSSITGQ